MKHYRPRSLWQVIVTDILLGALILGLTVFFQIGLPILQARSQSGQRVEPAPQTAAPATREPAPATAEPTADPGEMSADPSSTPEPTAEPTPEPTPDTRTEWQIRFEDHFTDEVVITDNSYTSPQVSIHIETREFVDDSNRTTVYHVADIYVASLDNFRTYTANNELRYFSTQDAMVMDRDSHAILAISGDFYAYQDRGFLMRNGQLYMSDQTRSDLCVLFNDGAIGVYTKDEYKVQDILDQGIVQAWNFGPSLLDADGHVKSSYRTGTAVAQPNPRSALGYYEPGHYVFVVVDGRQDGYSYGMTLPQLAQVFEDLGCTSAYNLDGGGSALMTFLHERYSRQSNGAGRKLSDLLIITEEGWEDNL